MAGNHILEIMLFTMIQCYGKELPNFVIFIADDLGIGDIGCYGNNTIRTPNIDYIAHNGVKLNHNLAAESVCTPSRAALLTSRYATRFGYTSSNLKERRVSVYTSGSGGLPTNEITFANVLKMKSYTNGYFGKWHLGIHCEEKDFCHFPLKHGFDTYYGMPLTNLQECASNVLYNDGRDAVHQVIHFSHTFILMMVLIGIFIFAFDLPIKMIFVFLACFCLTLWGLDSITVLMYRQFNCIVMKNYDVVEQPVQLKTLTQKLTKEVESFIETNRDKRFLAVVAYHKVHTALASTELFQGKSKHGQYGDNVEELDSSVGSVLNKLKNMKLLDKTFVYFTSDHGPALYMTVNGEMHGGWKGIYKGGKLTSYEGGIRVPTVAMFPNVIPQNHTYNKPTSGLDLFPTLLSFAETSYPTNRNIDGKDISAILKGDENRDDRFLFHYCGSQLQAVTYSTFRREDIWKLHLVIPNWNNGDDSCPGDTCNCFGTNAIKLENPLLYNLRLDPSESQPIEFNSTTYITIYDTITKAIADHKETIVPVESQLTSSKNTFSFKRQMCCNFPLCSC